MTRIKLLAFIFSAVPVIAFGQYKDAGLWVGVGISTDAAKNLKLTIAPELRLDENLSRVSSFFSDFEAEYELTKKISAGVLYRLGEKNRDNYYDLRQRWSGGINFKEKISEFSIGYAIRYQHTRSGNAPETDADFSSIVRNKISVKYTGMKKTDLYSSLEVFNSASSYNLLEPTGWRLAAGVQRSLNKRQSFSIGYLVQKNLLNLSMDFVITAGFKMELKTGKKKKDADKPKENSTG